MLRAAGQSKGATRGTTELQVPHPGRALSGRARDPAAARATPPARATLRPGRRSSRRRGARGWERARLSLIYGSAENRSAPAAVAPAAAAAAAAAPAAAATSRVSGSRGASAPAVWPRGCGGGGRPGLGGRSRPLAAARVGLLGPHLQELVCTRTHSGTQGWYAAGRGEPGPRRGPCPPDLLRQRQLGLFLLILWAGVSAGPLKACVLLKCVIIHFSI